MAPRPKARTAVVLSGGGTRGAYEAGVVNYMRTMLPPALGKNFAFQIFCGSSVGAINASIMVANAHDSTAQGQELVRLWQNLSTVDIYRRGPVTLGKMLLRLGAGATVHLIGLKGIFESDERLFAFHGLFDTAPFFQTLMKSCSWANITRNIDSGVVDAMAVSATNMATGQVELFLQKRPEVPHSERLMTHVGRISPRHVMASAALPVLFPPVAIHNMYYNDGGIRLSTPIAPAVSLGATQILVVGTRFQAMREEVDTQAKMPAPKPPSLAGVLGKFFHAVLLDRLETDKDQLERINRILAVCAKHTPPETFQQICEDAFVQPIETLYLAPSVDIATLADETLRSNYRKLETFGVMERTILRLLEIDEMSGSDLLSYFLFEPTYLRKLIDLGFEDARARHDQLAEFAEKSIRAASG
ncbi:MAG: patatin-like phospholipase family protein [Pseudomonadota bacterium]